LSETITAPDAEGEEQAGSRRRLHQILESAHAGDITSRVIDRILILLISGSVIAVILESIVAVELAYADFFYWFEVVTVAIFTVEYFLRIWCSVDGEKHAHSGMRPWEIRLRFIFSPYAIIDFLAILPFYLLMGGVFGDVDMRFLRCIRLLRILKLTRYSSAFDMLVTTCRENARPLGAAFFILVTVRLLSAISTVTQLRSSSCGSMAEKTSCSKSNTTIDPPSGRVPLTKLNISLTRLSRFRRHSVAFAAVSRRFASVTVLDSIATNTATPKTAAYESGGQAPLLYHQ